MGGQTPQHSADGGDRRLVTPVIGLRERPRKDHIQPPESEHRIARNQRPGKGRTGRRHRHSDTGNDGARGRIIGDSAFRMDRDLRRDNALDRGSRTDIDPRAVEPAPILPVSLRKGIEVAVSQPQRNCKAAIGGGAIEKKRIIALRIRRRAKNPGALGGGNLRARRPFDHRPVRRNDRFRHMMTHFAGPGLRTGHQKSQ